MRWERPLVRLQEFWLGMSRSGLALELPVGWCSARRSIARKNAAPECAAIHQKHEGRRQLQE